MPKMGTPAGGSRYKTAKSHEAEWRISIDLRLGRIAQQLERLMEHFAIKFSQLNHRITE